MDKQINSHQYEQVYKDLSIDVNKLGCVMIDLKPFSPELLTEATIELQDCFYYTENDEHFWINGFTLGKNPHITLLYGLLQSGPEIKSQIDAVLDGWQMDSISIKEVSYFDSQLQDADRDHYCVIAKIDINANLLEGRSRLSLLPHIDTFADYVPHITIGYIKKDPDVLKKVISFFIPRLEGKTFSVDKINYGGNKND